MWVGQWVGQGRGIEETGAVCWYYFSRRKDG